MATPRNYAIESESVRSFRFNHNESDRKAIMSAHGPSAKFLAPAKKGLVIEAMRTRIARLEFFAI
jgi:hypothetical protein